MRKEEIGMLIAGVVVLIVAAIAVSMYTQPRRQEEAVVERREALDQATAEAAIGTWSPEYREEQLPQVREAFEVGTLMDVTQGGWSASTDQAMRQEEGYSADYGFVPYSKEMAIERLGETEGTRYYNEYWGRY